mgnify:FL=1
MALIDSYRRDVASKKEQKTKILRDKAKEMDKISKETKKILDAKTAIQRTKSQSTINSKLRTIQRSEKNLSNLNKRVAKLDEKISKLDKEIINAERKVRKEEEKIEAQRLKDEKKRILESERQSKKIEMEIKKQGINQQNMQNSIDNLKKVPEEIIVLFLSANPIGTEHLRLDEEAREIEDMIRKSKHRESVRFISKWAVRPLDILQAINEYNPTIIHFSGHGSEDNELALENPDGTTKLTSKEAIVQSMTTASDNIKLVFFNNCYSSEQAKSVIKYVDFSIGMNDSIGDRAAIIFAAQFYSAIGFGKTISDSFNQSKSALMLEGIPEESTPELYSKVEGMEKNVILVKPKEVR